jgi:transposase-like protein
MGKIRDKSKYLNNPNIEEITGSNIRFTKQFKLKAIKLYQSGVSATDIFMDAGVDLSDFDKGYPRKSITRWLEMTKTYGIKEIDKERRGVNASGRPGSNKFKSLEEENAYLRAENNFLKKLRALEVKSVRKKDTK